MDLPLLLQDQVCCGSGATEVERPHRSTWNISAPAGARPLHARDGIQCGCSSEGMVSWHAAGLRRSARSMTLGQGEEAAWLTPLVLVVICCALAGLLCWRGAGALAGSGAAIAERAGESRGPAPQDRLDDLQKSCHRITPASMSATMIFAPAPRAAVIMTAHGRLLTVDRPWRERRGSA